MISTRIMVLGDIHAPYEDKAALRLAHKCVDAWKPQIIISIGDLIDCYSISDYPKTPRRFANLKSEVTSAAAVVRSFQQKCDEFHLTEGNHEWRLQKYLATRAPELFGLVDMRELLGLQKRYYHPYRTELKLGKCYFTHEVGFCGAGAAARSLAAFGGNLVFGHSHRAEVTYDRNLRGESHFCMNVGWLGDPRMVDYAHRSRMRNWQHGVGLVTQNQLGESWCEFVPFVRGKCVIEGVEVKL